MIEQIRVCRENSSDSKIVRSFYKSAAKVILPDAIDHHARSQWVVDARQPLGELQPPAPALAVESGFTFSADAVAFDADTVLADVADELPDSSIEGFAIEGGDGGIVRYLVSTRSPQGGVLAVTVAPDGAILEVDPL